MPRGRTIFEALAGRAPAAGVGPYNPLGARVGDPVRLDVLDYRDLLWRVEEVWAWEGTVGGRKWNLADYVIDADDAPAVLRCVPDWAAGEARVEVLLLHQLWPEGRWGPAPYGDDVRGALEALDDPTGELYRFRGTEAEERYWRVGGAVPVVGEARAEAAGEAVRVGPFTYWDFHRDTTDEGGSTVREYLYGQLSGRYEGPDRIRGGDKTLVMYRGREIDPKRVAIYGRGR